VGKREGLMICVMQSPFMSQFYFNPSALPYRFVFPETTTLDAWWPFGIIALFISCTDLFAYGCDSRKGFACASSVIFFTSSNNGGSSYEDVFIPRSARNGRLHTFFACICFQFVS